MIAEVQALFDRAGPEPETLVLLAWHHGMTGLVYKSTKDPDLRKALFKNYALAAANTVAHMQVLNQLRAEGLEFLPFKGASLISRGLYAPDDRPLLDLDLLIRSEDMKSFVALAAKMGFVAHPTSAATGITLHRGRLNIDLHTRPFMSELHVPVKSLWLGASEGLLKPEHEMLLVALHAAKSRITTGLRLIWRVDMSRLSKLANLGKTLDIARAWGVESPVLDILLSPPARFIDAQGGLGSADKILLSIRAGHNLGLNFIRMTRAILERIGQ